MILNEIWIYPIKSLPGCRVQFTHLNSIGCRFDRSFMLINSQGEKITQRKHPVLSQIKMELHEEAAILRFKNQTVELNLNTTISGGIVHSNVWNDPIEGIHDASIADEFFSDILNEKTRLIQKTGERTSTLPNSQKIASSLADSLPLLVIGTSSLNYIQSQLSTNFEMHHFRPNLVIQTTQPFIEDEVIGFQIGSTEIRFGKKCGRCGFINVNPEDGTVNKNRLSELGKIRRENNKTYFGSLFYPNALGVLTEGDEIHPIFD